MNPAFLTAIEALREVAGGLLELCEEAFEPGDARLMNAREGLESADAAIDQIKCYGPEI